MVRYDVKDDEDLACELSRESDPACFQLCGALSSVAHFDAYAAGCTKSTLDFVVDKDEKRDATYTALSRSVLTVLIREELSAHELMRLFMRQNTVGAETSARCSST